MLKAFLENCKRPKGGFGRLILRGMNSGHGPVAGWAFDRMEWPVNGRILDIGCGGGGNIARLLRRAPDPDAAAETLLHAALEAGGRDNVTILPVFCNA